VAIFIDKGMKRPDDPIFREGIGFVSNRKSELTNSPPPAPFKPKPQFKLKPKPNKAALSTRTDQDP